MGFHVDPVDHFDIEVKQTVRIELKGTCPKCENKFEAVLRSFDDRFECLCGGMSYDPETGMVRTDAHGIPKKEWEMRYHRAFYALHSKPSASPIPDGQCILLG